MNRFKELRKEKGMTQKQVAEILGVDRSAYAHYEMHGVYPTKQRLIILSKLFNVSIDYLLNVTDDRQPFTSKSKERKDTDMEYSYVANINGKNVFVSDGKYYEDTLTAGEILDLGTSTYDDLGFKPATEIDLASRIDNANTSLSLVGILAVETSDNDAKMIVTVRDNGLGSPEEQDSRIGRRWELEGKLDELLSINDSILEELNNG